MKMLIVVSMMTQTFPGSSEKDSHISTSSASLYSDLWVYTSTNFTVIWQSFIGSSPITFVTCAVSRAVSMGFKNNHIFGILDPICLFTTPLLWGCSDD